MSSFWLYLILKLDTLRGFLAFTTIISLVFLIIIFLISSKESDKDKQEKEENEKITKSIKVLFYIVIISLIINIIIPSTKQALVITFGPKILSNSLVKKSPDKIDKILDLYIEKLQNEVKK